MPDGLYFNNTFKALGNTLDILKQRHELLAGNISNLDTPGYKPRELDFKDALSNALTAESRPANSGRLTRTDPGHIQAGTNGAFQAEIVEEADEFNGLNHVNLDKEMTRLMENNLMYKTTVEMLLKKINLLKEVIREGGR